MSSRSNGRGYPSCKLCGAQLEDAPHFISACLSLETKTQGATQTRPTTSAGPGAGARPDTERDPDLFAHVMLGIDWVEDIKLQVFQARTLGAWVGGGGVRRVRTNRPLCGRGPRRCMRVHGAWPPCSGRSNGRVGLSLVPRPSATTPRRKIGEGKKEGLVNRHTTSCSSAGMLAELIKT